MRTLQIMLFGEVRVSISRKRTSAVQLTPIVQALLAYLLLHRQRCHSREVLTGLFWGDYSPERARRCLSTALWRLRRHLEVPNSGEEPCVITTPAGNIGFNCECDYWLDVEAFERPANRTLARSTELMKSTDVQELERALQFYTGELLEGFYDDWVLRERERFRSLFLSYLVQLMNYYRRQHDYERSLTYAQQILTHDPLREEIHRETMRLYLESGQRALAVRQYKLCAQILSEELGISPMEETQRLYAEVTQATNHQSLTGTFEGLGSWPQMLRQLRQTLRGVEATREQLRQLIEVAEKLARQRD